MASVAHLAAGALCGAAYARKTSTDPAIAVAGFAALAVAPDLDLLAAGWSYSFPPVTHRVMTHALPVSLVVGAALGLLAARGRRALASVFCALSLVSHGVLDAMTANDPGPQLLWPFARRAVQLPWQPIPGTETYQQYFTAEAIPIVAVEALWSVPFVVLTSLLLWRRRGRAGEPSGHAAQVAGPR